jgi:hypothetical protein
MTHDDQRNTLIVELSGRTNQSLAHFQSLNDDALAGAGAVNVFLSKGGIRTDAQLKTISDDDQRNILIVELGAQTHLSGPVLQRMSNIDLVILGLGKGSSFIRGVLLAGQFRTQHQINTMTHDDQRNTLIVELAGRTNQLISHFQSLNDDALAGAGAVLLFLSKGGVRTDAQLKTISDDDQRNIAIVEIGAQTNLGSKLQGLSNMNLVLAALGVDPVFPPSLPLPDQVDFDFPNITFNNGIPVGGFMHLTLFRTGDYLFTGHLHNSSGFVDFDLSAMVGVIDSAKQLFTFPPVGGHVAGKDLPGPSDFNWGDDPRRNPLIAQHWPTLAVGSTSISTESASSDFASLTNTLKDIAGVVVGVIPILDGGPSAAHS